MDEAESILINNIEDVTLDYAASLFYFYAKNRVGGKALINKLMGRFN